MINFDSLMTEGGKLAIALTMLGLFLFCAFVLHLTGHDPGETGRNLLSDAVASLMTLIVTKLQTKS